VGTYDTSGGTPRSPEELFCEYWEEEKGYRNSLCKFYDQKYAGNCAFSDKRRSEEVKELKKKGELVSKKEFEKSYEKWRENKMKKVFIPKEQDVREYELKNKVKVVSGELKPEGLYADIIDISAGFFIDVWNCQGRVVLWGEKEDWSDNKYITSDEYQYDEKLHEELVNTVIYDDNDGAINMSGHYYPQSEKSQELFKEFIQTVKKK